MRGLREGFKPLTDELSPRGPHPVEFNGHDLAREVTEVPLDKLRAVVGVVVVDTDNPEVHHFRPLHTAK